MMIVDLQRRIHESGRIRLGRKVGDKGRPERIDKFRFTSRSERAIARVAEEYGGEPREWADAPGEAKQWELFTKAQEIDVVVPPTDMALSQAYEAWSGGGCQRRCDGEREYLSDSPCLCAAEQDAGAERLCNPTTRLNVMLTKVEGFGVWRLESHGFYAASELAGAAELCQIAAATGKLQAARLRIDTRTGKKPKKGGGTMTVHYVVPVLDIDLPLAMLLPNGAQAAIAGGPATPAATGPGFTPVDADALPAGPQPSVEEQLGALDGEERKPRSNAAQPIPETGKRERRGAPDAPTEEPPDEPEAEDPKVAADRAQRVAIMCKEITDSDDWRHRFLFAFSEGAYSSAHEVPPDALAQMHAVLVRIRKGQIGLVEADGVWTLKETAGGKEAAAEEGGDLTLLAQPVEGEVQAGTLAEAGPAPDIPEGKWDRERWLAAVENVPGIGQAKLLRKAREIAKQLSIKVPASLDECTDRQLGAQLLGWLRDQQGA